MKKKYLFFIITGAIAIVAFLTNPNQTKHKEAVKNKVSSSLQKSAKQNVGKSRDRVYDRCGVFRYDN